MFVVAQRTKYGRPYFGATIVHSRENLANILGVFHRVGRGADEEQGENALLRLPVMFRLNGGDSFLWHVLFGWRPEVRPSEVSTSRCEGDKSVKARFIKFKSSFTAVSNPRMSQRRAT